MGVSILEIGTSNGTVTDLDGNFTLSVPKGVVLRISYVGYLVQEVPINGKTYLDIFLKEMGVDAPLGSPKADVSKTWMDFDASLPAMPRMPEKKVVLTLRPYTANTKYNWDPVYQKKITVNKNTWRGDPFYELTRLKIYTDWAKRPLDAEPRESIEQIEATGLRYMVTERANNMAVGSWRSVGGGGIAGDFMRPFTKDFWNRKAARRRARTLEVLRTYGDSITARRKETIIK